MIDREPQLGVFLASGPTVTFTLLQEGDVEAAGQQYRLPAGAVTVQAYGAGLRIASLGRINLGPHLQIHAPAVGRRVFAATLQAPDGKRPHLEFAGQPEVHLDSASRKAVLVERIGMETYLAGVVPTEMNPGWPLEALKAQAVVARSYALDRFLQNRNDAWQLHWHYTVDMAYSGVKPLAARVGTALEQTRGDVLAWHGLPVPTLFHACSGGRTESAAHFRPDLKGGDKLTDMTVVMPSIEDPAAEAGTRALGMQATHWEWRATLPMRSVSAALQDWAEAHPRQNLVFGTVDAVRPAARFPDSGRVSKVAIRHRLRGKELETLMDGNDFRLAVGPGVVRSTNWLSCTIAAHDGGTLVIAGRGYGHGVGMSQVSAYQLAKTGNGADDILRLFYPVAALVKMWP
ncbi:MAG: SpoIID/LytB domain-containing protein [Planctomycetes bacterium]|nr:SpoIID/LytB domain-containing protein [Planctomycetota bacterium]